MDLGHLEDPDLTVTVDWTTAKAIFVEQNPQAGMQAFMAGKVKVQGDMTKLMAMQQSGTGSCGPGDRRQDQGDDGLSHHGPVYAGSRGFGPGARRGAPFAFGRRRRGAGAAHEERRDHPERRDRGADEVGGVVRRDPAHVRLACRLHRLQDLDPGHHTDLCIICCAAPTTPRSSSATALAMAAVMAGAVVPMPTPDSASEPTINKSVLSAPICAKPIIDTTMNDEPMTAFVRSPILVVM